MILAIIVALVCIIIGSILLNSEPEEPPYPQLLSLHIRAVQDSASTLRGLAASLDAQVYALYDTAKATLAYSWSDGLDDAFTPYQQVEAVWGLRRPVVPVLGMLRSEAEAFDGNAQSWTPATAASTLMAQKEEAKAMAALMPDIVGGLKPLADAVLKLVADWKQAYSAAAVEESQEMLDTCAELGKMGDAFRADGGSASAPLPKSAQALQASYMALYDLVASRGVGARNPLRRRNR